MRRPVLLLWGALAVAGQVAALYSPTTPEVDVGGGLPLDKAVHLLLFAIPTTLLVTGGLRWWLVGAALAAHALLSEVVQGTMAQRAGDPLDLLADLIGVAVGLVVADRLLARVKDPADPPAPGRPSASSRSAGAASRPGRR